MAHHTPIRPRAYKCYTGRNLEQVLKKIGLSTDDALALRACASVLSFRVNDYVLEELIDWNNVPDDPIYQLTFPQRGMLEPEDLKRMIDLLKKNAGPGEIADCARQIRRKLNPHPAGQTDLNVPRLFGRPVLGAQHKYHETVLLFPAQGQSCHAFCTYCFRWPQFVNEKNLKIANRDLSLFLDYIRRHKEITDVLITGGDPMIMKIGHLRRYIEPLLSPGMEHVQHIRIGTKALAYWPFRFVTDPDADEVLRLFEKVIRAGKHVAIMAHFSHPRELSTNVAKESIRRLRDAGCQVRCQAPVVKHVNDKPDVWAALWKEQVWLGCVPYYMFVQRDTGPRHYFGVSLVRSHEIFTRAYCKVSGLARTVRGPSMSAKPGKVLLHGTADIYSQKVFVLSFIQARNPHWVGHPFFARFDPAATWFDELEPALGRTTFFFEPEMMQMEELARAWRGDAGLRHHLRRALTE